MSMTKIEKIEYMRGLHDRAVALRRKVDAINRVTGAGLIIPTAPMPPHHRALIDAYSETQPIRGAVRC
jgi:hypothetical protein